MNCTDHYIKVNTSFDADNEESKDILIAELAEAGAESFDEEANSLNAYFPKRDYSAENVERIFENNIFRGLKYSVSIIEPQNWNAIWESNFHPVIIGDECVVYAPFHVNLPDTKYKILVSPEMTFGTGHHETTHLMLEAVLAGNLQSLAVLDMGCGTGILAILAAMKGASKVLAVDNDPTAVENTCKNAELNRLAGRITAVHGDESTLHECFDLILANINRNILLNSISLYSECLNVGGRLMISGFYRHDVPLLVQEARSVGLQVVKSSVRNEWAMIEFVSAT